MKMPLLAALLAVPSFACACGGMVGGAGSTQDNSGGDDGHVSLAIALGEYAHCKGAAALHHSLDGKEYFQTAGGAGTLTLEESAGVVKATLGGSELRAAGTIEFTATTPTTAIAAGGDLSVNAVTDPPDVSPITVDVPIDAGALTLVGQTLFLSVANGPRANYFFACDAPSGAPSSASPASDATFATGVFSDCSSTAGVQLTGGLGSVTLTRTGGVVTATPREIAATNDPLAFDVTSDGLAQLVDGQTPAVPTFSCTLPGAGGLTLLQHAAGILLVHDDVLFIDLTGATSCEAQFPTFITCKRGG